MKDTNAKLWCVYMHINKINDKKYIGVTKGKPEKRWGKNGCGYLKDQPVFANAIKKYTWNGFRHEVLATNLTQREALDMEIALIAEYKSNCNKYKNPSYGYNMTDGGEGSSGFKHTDETKQKLSEIRSNPSDETRKRMSESAKERCTDEWRKETSIMQSGSKKPQCSNPCSEDIKRKIGQKNSKSVYQKTLNGEIIRKFSSQSEAERITGVHQAAIWRCCNHKQKSAGGYAWDYADNCNEPHKNRMQKVIQLDFDGNYIREWECATYAEEALGIIKCKITECCKGQRKSTGGFNWMYKDDYDKLTQQNDLTEEEDEI
jgi:group I intron endonuclease